MHYTFPLTTRPFGRKAFSLIEVLVATAVLAILLSLIMAILNSVSTTVRHTSSKVDAFSGARAALTILSQRLSQATLNTYWAYDKPPPQTPTAYLRASDLQFAITKNAQSSGSGQEIYFQTPQSFSSNNDLRLTEGLLNAGSFFVRFGDNDAFRPGSLTEKKYRYRLMQGLQPTELLTTFKDTPTTSGQPTWAGDIANKASLTTYVTPIADNVIAAIFWPRLSPNDDASGTKALTEDYTYDSKKDATQVPQPATANQLPPMVQVTLVVISEASAARLDKGASAPNEIQSALQGRFTDPSRYKTDLEELQRALADKNIEFEIFTTSVPLSGSKWSDDQ